MSEYWTMVDVAFRLDANESMTILAKNATTGK
jgi:hypothetical protein